MKPKNNNNQNELRFYSLDSVKLDNILLYGDSVPAGQAQPSKIF